MPPTQNDAPAWLLPAIILGFPIVFGTLWTVICIVLSAVGGWGRLAQRYAAQQPSTIGQQFSSQSGRVGVVNYNRILKICTSPAGLYLDVFIFFRPGHKPLLIPWSEIHNGSVALSFFVEYVAVDVGSPEIARLRLPKKIFAGQPVLIDGQSVPA